MRHAQSANIIDGTCIENDILCHKGSDQVQPYGHVFFRCWHRMCSPVTELVVLILNSVLAMQAGYGIGELPSDRQERAGSSGHRVVHVLFQYASVQRPARANATYSRL